MMTTIEELKQHLSSQFPMTDGNIELYRLAQQADSEIEALTRERDALKIEYESRAIWIAKMLKALDCENKDGFHCVDAHVVAEQLRTQNRELRELLTEARYLIAKIGTTGVERTDIIRKADKWITELARIKEVEGCE